MAGIKMTYELAMAAGRDAANRNMRANGRTAWSEEDYDKAVETFERLYPVAAQLRDQATALATAL